MMSVRTALLALVLATLAPVAVTAQQPVIRVAPRLSAPPRPVLPTIAPPPAALTPQVRTQILTTMMGSAPPPLGASFTLSVRNPLAPGQGRLMFQNVVNSAPGALDGGGGDLSLGYASVRYRNNGGSPFGNVDLELKATPGKGVIIDCKLGVLVNPLVYSVYTPEGGATDSSTKMTSTGHLIIPLPRATVAGSYRAIMRPSVENEDLSFYSCEISSY